LNCTCAPVFDYTGREVARVGLFGHAPDETALMAEGARGARDLARLVSGPARPPADSGAVGM